MEYSVSSSRVFRDISGHVCSSYVHYETSIFIPRKYLSLSFFLLLLLILQPNINSIYISVPKEK